MLKIFYRSAIGVQLSTGDISIIGIGTATYCQDNYVLAFGHPFLHRGDVSYLFTSVYISQLSQYRYALQNRVTLSFIGRGHSR